MPAALSYVTVRAGDTTPTNVVVYPLDEMVWTPIPPANNNIKMWGTADESMGGGTGTFPAEGDVKLGVDYGPTGVEYEGTYMPAAGGVFIRSRASNE